MWASFKKYTTWMHGRQLTIAEVTDRVKNDSKHGITASRARERRESVKCNVNGLPSLMQVKECMGSFPRDLIDSVETGKAGRNYFALVRAGPALPS